MENSTILALDVGDRRVGVAIANTIAKLASPLCAIDRKTEDVWEALAKLISKHDPVIIAIGLPRGLEGQETAQTATVREFVSQFESRFDIPVHLQDEALTSRQAEEELRSRGVGYTKGDIDALAATYILADFLNNS
jgi:putative Holliday junction resolvase